MEPVTDTLSPDHEPAPKLRPRARLGRLLVPTWIALTLLNLAATGWLALHRPPNPVAFDMKGTIDQFMEQSARQSLSEQQSQQLVARFTTALDDSLATWQRDHHALILVSPSVIKGADDITHAIQQDIATRMRGAP